MRSHSQNCHVYVLVQGFIIVEAGTLIVQVFAQQMHKLLVASLQS